MTRRANLGLIAAVALGLLSMAAVPVRAQGSSGPRPGTYKIVFVQLTTGTVTSTLVLRADGTYQVYDLGSREPRGGGTWKYDPVARRVFWLTGLNNEMNRGGAFTVEEGGRVHRISMGRQVYAINGD